MVQNLSPNKCDTKGVVRIHGASLELMLLPRLRQSLTLVLLHRHYVVVQSHRPHMRGTVSKLPPNVCDTRDSDDLA